MAKQLVVYFAMLFVLGCSASETRDSTDGGGSQPSVLSGEDRPLLGFSKEAVIKPFVAVTIDWQFSKPIDTVRYVPEDLRTVGDTTVREDSVKAPIVMEWRFVKLGMESWINDDWRLSLYGDASLNMMYLFDMSINADEGVYYAVNYSPVVVPGVKADLDYFFYDRIFARLGGGVRWYDAVIERGTASYGDSRNFGGRHYESIAGLTEYSSYLGIGYRYKDLSEIGLRFGLEFIDSDLKNQDIRTERMSPVPFGGFTVEFRW